MALYRLNDGVYAKDAGDADDYLTDLVTPQLKAVMYFVEQEVYNHLSLDVVYTSIFRESSGSVHKYGRGADVRVYHPDRGIPKLDYGAGIMPEHIKQLLARLDSAFAPWVGLNHQVHHAGVAHGDGLDYHLHLQAPPGPWGA